MVRHRIIKVLDSSLTRENEMTYQQAREYLAAHNRSECPMTYDEAFELVSHSDNMTDDSARVNGRARWARDAYRPTHESRHPKRGPYDPTH